MSAFNDIRQALEIQIASVTGIPDASHRAWENVRFTPVTGEAWVRMRLQPTSRRAAARGDQAQDRFQGLFIVDVFQPLDKGPSIADTLADAICDAYNTQITLTRNTTTVRFDYSERSAGIPDAPWYMVPVFIAWYTYI